jgi:hypothetical protein
VTARLEDTTETEVASVVLTSVVREVLRPVARTRQTIEDVLGHLRIAPRSLAEQEIVRRHGRQWHLASPFFRAWLLSRLDA